MSKDTSGPAFPIDRIAVNKEFGSSGMTLRDYFAAKAMQGIVSDPNLSMGVDKVAEWAYIQADAMLEWRNK